MKLTSKGSLVDILIKAVLGVRFSFVDVLGNLEIFEVVMIGYNMEESEMG